MSIEEASSYLGMGKTVLYAMARDTRIPARKIGKKWTFNRVELDQWALTAQTASSFFKKAEFHIEGNVLLREPQRDAYLRAYEFFEAGKNYAIIQIPVGCGKTGLAAILPFGIANGRALIIAPNLTIRRGLYEAMDITNRQKCFWKKTATLSDSQMKSGPLVCTLETGNISVAEKAHIVITNIQQLGVNLDKWLNQFPDKFFDLIIVDEAHHSAAVSWKNVFEKFPDAKVIHLTATPFRSDRKEIDGDLVYRYPFRSATLKGYIKRLKASYVAPSEIELSFTDERGRKYNLEEVLALKEEEWFSRGVALARPCNQNIVENSLSKLEELRLTGTKHQLIGVACSINHAKEICSLYRERGYTAEVIHSQLDEDKQAAILADLKNGVLDCIIQVQMLGEGFDHPKLSVAAIFRPFRSVAPYIQFIGRIMRVIVQGDPTHPDNAGHIVTHLGMNLDQRLKEFQQFESDDNAFWEKVIGGSEPEIPIQIRDGSSRLSARETNVIVNGEIVESLWEEDVTSLEDQHVIDDLRERFKLLGIDPEQAAELVKKSRQPKVSKRTAAEPFLVQPHREWEEAKRRLHEQSQRLAKILLNHLKLSMAGTEIPYKYTSLNIAARNNFIGAVMMVNAEINKRLGKERSGCSTDEFKAILNQLDDDVLQPLVRRLRKAEADHGEGKTQGSSTVTNRAFKRKARKSRSPQEK